MNKSYYAIIPANVRYDEDLNANAKLLYGEITALANERGYCWASNSYFADLYNVSSRTIIRWINDLIDKEYILSEIIYKENSKEIEQRRLWIATKLPTDKNVTPPCHTCHEPTDKVVTRGDDKNVTDNNTEFNNTLNNTDNSLLLQDTLNNMSNRDEKSQNVVADNIYQFYQQNMGVLNPLIGEKLQSWINDLGEELVKEALTKTVMNGSRSFSYAETIMRDWYNKKIKTIEEVQMLESDYQRRKKQFPASVLVSSKPKYTFPGIGRG